MEAAALARTQDILLAGQPWLTWPSWLSLPRNERFRLPSLACHLEDNLPDWRTNPAGPMDPASLLDGRCHSIWLTELASLLAHILGPAGPAGQQTGCGQAAAWLAAIIDRGCQCPAGVFFGARPFTQTLDIAHGLQAVIEKGLDDHSKGATAQMDIARCYDSIRLLPIVRWLQRRGLPTPVCAALLRQRMLPRVVLKIGQKIGQIQAGVVNRSVGSLTGARVASGL